MAVRMAGLAFGGRAEHGGDVVVAFDVGLLREIEIAAVRLALAGKSSLQIVLGLGALRFAMVLLPSMLAIGPATDPATRILESAPRPRQVRLEQF